MRKTRNRRKFLIAAVCLMAAVSVIAAAACTTEQKQEKSVFESVAELAAGAASAELSVSYGGETVYGYNAATSVESNPYGLDIDPAALMGEAAGGVLLTREALEEGYTLTYNSVTGEAVLSGILKNTQEWLGVNADGAEVAIIANLKAKSLSSYSVTYDTNGYTVRITLS